MWRTSCLLASALLLAWLPTGVAQADQARSFVSNGFGNDGNAPDCTRLAPCRTFQTAHDHTLDLGEITVLDPGSYGSVTITKNISIINDGVGEAGILVSGGFTGITVNAPADAAVTLRGLTIKGIGFGGGAGIVFNTGQFLSIESCVVRNLTGASPGVVGTGIVFKPTPLGNFAALNVLNTVVSDNSFSGIWVDPFGNGFVHAVFDHVQSNHNGIDGFVVEDTNFTGSIVTAVESSVASVNLVAGFEVVAPAGHGPGFITVSRSVSEGNNIGFRSGTSGVINVGQSTVTGNAHTWIGQVQSYQNNEVIENFDGDPAAPLGSVLPK